MYRKEESEIEMSVDWKRKKAATLKWLIAGPAFLFYQIRSNGIKYYFKDSIPSGLLLCLIFLIMPSLAIFLVYWPQERNEVSESTEKLNEHGRDQ